MNEEIRYGLIWSTVSQSIIMGLMIFILLILKILNIINVEWAYVFLTPIVTAIVFNIFLFTSIAIHYLINKNKTHKK